MKFNRLALAIWLFIAASPALALAANLDHVRQLLRTKNCPNCDLSEANLDRVDLSNAPKKALDRFTSVAPDGN